jgi:TatD DNase family protein
MDTHSHIHSVNYRLDPVEVLRNARDANVNRLICVGTSAEDSQVAVDFAVRHEQVWASVGLHPHDAQLGTKPLDVVAKLAENDTVVAIGECGLDYYYNHSPKEDQIAALRRQLMIAQDHQLPLIFHVREAFADFWPIFDEFPGTTGVLHSYTDNQQHLEAALERGLFLGLNGIMTFTNREDQLAVARAIPLEQLVLETDAPFLTPKPHRGKVNEPRNIEVIGAFLADLRGETVADLATVTTRNANKLFNLG